MLIPSMTTGGAIPSGRKIKRDLEITILDSKEMPLKE